MGFWIAFHGLLWHFTIVIVPNKIQDWGTIAHVPNKIKINDDWPYLEKSVLDIAGQVDCVIVN